MFYAIYSIQVSALSMRMLPPLRTVEVVNLR